MSKKYALIIGTSDYGDSGLAKLKAPGKDVEDLARVLRDKEICAFDEVSVLLNQPSVSVTESIDEFFDNKKHDDLLVLYYSGHGLRDEMGSLYLAFKNSLRSRLRATAIKSDYIREAMDQSRSKRQVVILDCCNSGAFPNGTKAEIGGPMGMAMAFQGYGRFVLTASDATQFAWEGDRLIGEAQNSLFTHFLIKGLEGDADENGDGRITVDELYDYAYRNIARITPKQTPTKSTSRQEGEFVLRDMRLVDIKPIPLPDELLNEIDDTRPYVREAALQKLEKIIQGKNIGMARSAMEALEKIASDENSTRRIANAATTTLNAYREKFEERHESAEEEKPQETNSRSSGGATIETSTPKIPENASAPPAARRKPLVWGIIGVISCCLLGAGASGLYSMMNGFSAATATPTQRATRTTAPTSTPTTRPTSTATVTLTPTLGVTITATPVPIFLPVFDTFQDSFDGNINDWDTGETSSDTYVGQKKLEDGMYIMESTETKKIFVTGGDWASAEILKDFNVSTHVRLLEGNPSDVCYGIRFRETPEKGFYLFVVCDSKFFRIRHYDYQASQWTSLQNWTRSNSIRTGEWNNLAVQALGSSFTFYINESRVAQLVNEKETEGTLFLALDIQTTVPGSIGFDDFSVQQVFYDGFSNNDNAWRTEQHNDDHYVGEARLENEIYTIESTTTKKGFVSGWGQTLQDATKDFNVSVKAKLLKGEPSNVCYGIRYRFNDHGYYVFEACDSKKYKISHYNLSSKEWTTLQDWTALEQIKPGDWNTLAVVAVGDTFTFYVNGQEINEIKDEKEPEGKIYMVLSVYDVEPGAVGYDDFVLVTAK